MSPDQATVEEIEHGDNAEPVVALDPQVALAIKDIFELKAITRVIVVDDFYRKRPDVLTFTTLESSLDSLHLRLEEFADKWAGVISLRSGEVLAGQDFIRAEFERLWDELPEEALQDLSALLLAATDSADDDVTSGEEIVIADSDAIIKLGAYLPHGTKIVRVGLEAWNARQSVLWADDYPSTLVFFDRDFSNEGGMATTGDRLIEELLTADRARIICGLLTHDPKDLDAIAEELAVTLGERAGQVSVIPKRALGEPAEFAQRLRVYVALDELGKLSTYLAETIDLAVDTSKDMIKGADPYFLMAMFAAAREEGQFELDGMLRRPYTAFRSAIDTAVRRSDLGLPIASLRRLLEVELKPFGLPKPVGFEAELRSERFIDGPRLSELNAPVDVGDIFAFRPSPTAPVSEKNPERLFVVLVQPCDLAVRLDGKRGHELERILVAEIVTRAARDDGTVEGLKQYEFEIPGIGKDERERMCVDVNSTRLVPAEALDACVFDREGKGRLKKAMKLSAKLSQAWQRRGTDLIQWCESIVAKVTAIEANLAPVTVKAERVRLRGYAIESLTQAGRVSTGVSIHVDTQGSGITFGVRRTGRIVSDVAKQILIDASHYRARPDIENLSMRDFDKNPLFAAAK
jgi:hypothetical protein